MKYACLIFGDGNVDDPLSPNELDALETETVAYCDELRRKGHLIAAHPLEPAHATTTIRMRDGRLAMTDGPFIETKEQLGGFFLIEARDLNEAIRVASGIPAVRWDTIEIRPMRDLPERS